jgi:hypothetical protein
VFRFDFDRLTVGVALMLSGSLVIINVSVAVSVAMLVQIGAVLMP